MSKTQKLKSFFYDVLLSSNPTSSKRLVTLLVTVHFLVSSFLILFLAYYVVFNLPKGRIDPILIELLKEVLEYDFYIILSGLGFIAVENFGTLMIERMKTKMAGLVQPTDKKDSSKEGGGDI